jgi:hypothetical protein
MIPEEVSRAMLVNLGAQSAALELGTRIPVSRAQVRFPVLSALPTAYFVNGDTGLKQTTEAAWDNKYINIEEMAAIVPIPENVLADVDFDVWEQIRPLLEGAIARLLDAAVFFGAGSPPASWPTNIVAGAVAAGNVVARGTNAAAAGGLFGDYSDLLATIEADGYVPDGAIGNITIKARERQVRDTTGQGGVRTTDMPDVRYILPGLWPTGSSAAEVIAGDFSQLVVAVRQDFTYKLITEGVITDNSGNIIYNLPQQDMVAMRIVFRAGWQVANPINYQQAVEASRYPFGVLRAP